MEELFVEAIFWSLGYGSSEKYQRILNSLWEKSEDENEPILLELEARHYEEAMAYLRSIMPDHFDSINEDFFGKCLMNSIKLFCKLLQSKRGVFPLLGNCQALNLSEALDFIPSGFVLPTERHTDLRSSSQRT